MTTRTVETEQARKMLIRFIEGHALPFTCVVEAGRKRSLQQNAISHKWYTEIADQRGDMTAAEVRAECKLVFGVPILREEHPEFRATYDGVLKPLPYETKLEFIRTTELPVTSIMTVKQKSRYLDAVRDHFRGQGILLTDPEDMAA